MKKKKIRAIPSSGHTENKVIEYLDRQKAVENIKEYAESMRGTDSEFKQIVHELHECRNDYMENIASARIMLDGIKEMRDELFGR